MNKYCASCNGTLDGKGYCRECRRPGFRVGPQPLEYRAPNPAEIEAKLKKHLSKGEKPQTKKKMGHRKLDPDVKGMDLHERGQEIMRIRKMIIEWVKAYNKCGNERCHLLDQDLASLVGMKLYETSGDLTEISVFLDHCKTYARRECRRGRLVDNTLPLTKQPK